MRSGDPAVRRGRGGKHAHLLLLAVLWAVTASLPSTSAVFTATTASKATFSAWVAAVPAVLTQPAAPAGTASCISMSGLQPCSTGTGLDGASSVAVAASVSPASGASVYVGGRSSDVVGGFSRSATTGFLTQLSGVGACVSHLAGGGCGSAVPLDGPQSLAVTSDGKSVYVAAWDSNAVTVLSRGTNGEVNRLSGTQGCVRVAPSSGLLGDCSGNQALAEPWSVTISPDDKHVYVLTRQESRIAILTRAPLNGGLSSVGCIRNDAADTGGSSCTITGGLKSATSLAFSPDGLFAYVAASGANAVTAFSRDPGTGWLAPLPGSGRCVGQSGDGVTCIKGVALWGASDVVVSPNGASVYVASAFSNAVAAFTRHPTTGVLSQLSGTAACISSVASDDNCATGRALSGASSLAISPDTAGKHVFVVAGGFNPSNSISVFHRNAGTGALTQASGDAGCISMTLTGVNAGCKQGRALTQPSDVVVTPDGKDVYVTSRADNAVTLFNRTP